MLNPTINQENVTKLLLMLGNSYQVVDKSISLIHFGSTVNKIDSLPLDIDILVLSENEYVDKKSKIKKMRKGLLNGKAFSGFRTHYPKIEKITSEIILNQHFFSKVDIIPKFVFGPFKYDATKKKDRIYLHFKGPLTTEEFLFFFNQLPFHGISIIENGYPIIGSLPFKKRLSNFRVSIDLLREFNKGLYLRVRESSNPHDIKKCIKKLIMNLDIYNRYSLTANNELSHILPIRNEPNIKLLNITEDIEILRNFFITTYMKIEKMNSRYRT